MSYVITRLCRDCVDQSCVEVCPVDCIVEHTPPEGKPSLPKQLYIQPDECIDCNACVPACPWEAIYPGDDVPHIFEDDIALNALSSERADEFQVARGEVREPPSPEDVARNKTKWGLDE